MYFKMRLGDGDQDITDWLDAQENKTAAVKAVIRAAIHGTPNELPLVDLDLSAIRAVIETALDERLTGVPVADRETQEDQELALKLDAMF